MEFNAEKFGNEDAVAELNNLLKHLKERTLSKATEDYISLKLQELKRAAGTEKEKAKTLTAAKNDILEHLRKEHNLVPENYYTTHWMPVGMSAFGLPIGVVFFAVTDNSAFIALGLPLGLGLGSLYGATLDKKAEADGRVLKYEKEKNLDKS